ncbi:MAG: DUF2520 domain-containing protein [Clostridia bacterium]|nr:DUF2520 domain-containing protein [Clostridia bacterium]
MKIGIIGAGKVGSSLATGLKKNGFTVSGLYSRRDEPVKMLSDYLGIPYENNLVKTVQDADILLIAVSDSNISHIALEISDPLKMLNIKDKTFIHVSGALSSEELEVLAQHGGYTASLHPIQTFADSLEGWRGLYGIYYGFEGNEKALKVCERITDSFGGKIIKIKKDEKKIYHAALCILSNYMVALSYAAENLFESIGVDRKICMEAFMPIIKRTVSNIETLGSLSALTGPISRGDIGTVETHLWTLKERNPEVLEVYKTLGKVAVDIAFKKGTIKESDADTLLGKLSKE